MPVNKIRRPLLKDGRQFPGTDERYFLEGPRSRARELFFIIKVLWEFIRGFRVFHFTGPCIAVFGSARVKPGAPYYEMAQKLGADITKLGFGVMTGGGPGLMEAANRGAHEAGGISLGCNIKLPKEQAPNAWLDKYFNCKYFFVRKVLMFKYSYGFVILPGGVGTMDEFFEALTLIQTHKILNFPIVLMNKAYWEPVMGMFHRMLDEYMISPKDLRYMLITDSGEEAIEHLRRFAISKYKLRRRKIFRRFFLLGE